MRRLGKLFVGILAIWSIDFVVSYLLATRAMEPLLIGPIYKYAVYSVGIIIGIWWGGKDARS